MLLFANFSDNLQCARVQHFRASIETRCAIDSDRRNGTQSRGGSVLRFRCNFCTVAYECPSGCSIEFTWILGHKRRADTACVGRRQSQHRRQMKAELDAAWERLTLDDFFLQRNGLAVEL
jgi:hypothetical protein